MTHNIFLCSPVILALIAALITWFFTILGSATVVFFKKVNKNVMDIMLGLAAGVMLAASYWSLLEPGIQNASLEGQVPFIVASLGFLSGATLIIISDKLINKVTKKYDINTKNKLERSMMLIFSITVHNIPEGLAVGLAFGSMGNVINETVLVSAFVFALGIAIQNFPEGAAVSLPLRREGFTRWRAFVLGGLSGIVEPISAVIGALLVLKIKSILPFFVCFAAGALVFVVVKELIPESQNNKNKNLITFFTIIGFVIMMILDVSLG